MSHFVHRWSYMYNKFLEVRFVHKICIPCNFDASGQTAFHGFWQCMRMSISSHPWQHNALSRSLTFAYLIRKTMSYHHEFAFNFYNIYMALVCARYCYKHFTNTNIFNTHNFPKREVLLLFPIYWYVNWSTLKLSCTWSYD